MFIARTIAFIQRPIRNWHRASMQEPVGSPRASERMAIHPAGIDPERILRRHCLEAVGPATLPIFRATVKSIRIAARTRRSELVAK
jgi:hypothetical protein